MSRRQVTGPCESRKMRLPHQQEHGIQELTMLDAAFIRDNLEAVRTNIRNRKVAADPDSAVRLDDERKRLVQETQVLQQRGNEVAKKVGGVSVKIARGERRSGSSPSRRWDFAAVIRPTPSRRGPELLRRHDDRRDAGSPPCVPAPKRRNGP